jgi:hypothetical protein
MAGVSTLADHNKKQGGDNNSFHIANYLDDNF